MISCSKLSLCPVRANRVQFQRIKENRTIVCPIGEFGNLAKEANTLIIPSNLSDVSSIIASAMTVIKHNDRK